MKKTIIIAGMTVFFAAAGMAGAEGAGGQSISATTPQPGTDKPQGQKIIAQSQSTRDAGIIRQYNKMTAEFVSVHKQMVSENPEMQDLNNTGNLSDEMVLQHTSMLLQLDYMRELMAVLDISYPNENGQIPRADLQEMQKITSMATGNDPVLLGLPGASDCKHPPARTT